MSNETETVKVTRRGFRAHSMKAVERSKRGKRVNEESIVNKRAEIERVQEHSILEASLEVGSDGLPDDCLQPLASLLLELGVIVRLALRLKLRGETVTEKINLAVDQEGICE